MSVGVASGAHLLRRTTGWANSQPLTVSCWFYVTGTLAFSYRTPWGHDGGSLFGTAFPLVGCYDEDFIGTARILLRFRNGASHTIIASASADTWYYVAAVFNGTSSPAVVYHATGNGALATSTTAANFEGFDGGDLVLFASGDGNGLEGRMGSTKVWTAALSAAEIAREHKQVKPQRHSDLYSFHPFVNSTAEWAGKGNTFTPTGTIAAAAEYPPIAWERQGILYVPAVGGGGGTDYTFDADPGSLTLTGGTANLEHGRRLVADAGALTLTGGAANLEHGRRLVAESGGLTLAGGDATLRRIVPLAAAPGSLVLTGGAATLRRTHQLGADAGTITLSGGAVALNKGHRITADAGSLSLSSEAATLLRAYQLKADPSGLSLAGDEATLTRKVTLTASPGALTLAGAAAGLLKQWVLVASPGGLTLFGTDTTLTYSGAGPGLAASPGALTLIGGATSLEHGRRLVADSGVVMLTGGTATLRRGFAILAAAAALSLVGGEAALSQSRGLVATTGAITLTGGDATLRYGTAYHRAPESRAGVFPADSRVASFSTDSRVGTFQSDDRRARF